jgi:NhaP-type Na+/H+ or K+/H+ antiporter
MGIILGPIAGRLLDVDRWASRAPEQEFSVTLGICRVVIGVQLVIAGFQLPAKYQMLKWVEMTICLLPVMTIMWLCTTACILLTIPKISLLAALVIGSCVTCTDPILSQAVAKGPFSDKFVPRALREIISSEAGANDGFGFPFLMLAVYLIRHADLKNVVFKTPEIAAAALNETLRAGEMMAPGVGMPNTTSGVVMRGLRLLARAEKMEGEATIGRLGGGITKAMEMWFVEGWIYIIFMSVAIGVVLGYGSCLAIKFCLRKKWIDNESFLLWPTGLGLFTIGVCGLVGTDDLLACFVAGNAFNWNGLYLEESDKRHDEVNSCVDVILNFGGFMYIGTILPWDQFQMPEVTGITVGRLIILGVLVMFFRRLPAIFITYKLMPKVCKDWKEALFMGWFGPIGKTIMINYSVTYTHYALQVLAPSFMLNTPALCFRKQALRKLKKKMT